MALVGGGGWAVCRDSKLAFDILSKVGDKTI